MASSDDFKAQLKTGNLTEALALALSKAVELKITTWVTAAEDVETTQTKPGHRLCTHINTIEGKIENEIGDQFIGNGRYRELQQFHLEQVAQSNQIIQSNLKSLQKLFEVMIAMGYQGTATAVFEPNTNQVESQLLPPVKEFTDATPVNESVASAVEESSISPNSLTENVIPAASVAAATAAFLTIPEESLDELGEEEEDDDWDDSVLDLLESLPVQSPDQAEDLYSDMDEDWRNFIKEDESPEPEELDLPVNLGRASLAPENLNLLPTFSELNVEQLNSQKDEDLGDIVTENLSPKLVVGQDEERLNWEDSESSSELPEPSIETPNSENEQDWGDLIEEEEPYQDESDLVTAELSGNQGRDSFYLDDFRSPPTSAEPPLELANSAEDDEDWGDLIEDEQSPEPDNLIPSMDSLDLEAEDEWDDWIVEDSEPLQNTPVMTIDSLDVSEDHDWADFEENSDPFTTAPTSTASESSSEDDEDWDDFASDELEPYTPMIDLDANVGDDFNLSDQLENLNSEESAIQETDHPDLLDENQNIDASTAQELHQDLNNSASQSEEIPPPQENDRDLMDVLFKETEFQQNQPHPATDDDLDVDIREEDLFADDMQFEQLTANASARITNSFTVMPAESDQEVETQDSDSLIVSEDDLKHQAQSDKQRMPPPPPPPSRLPNQNY